jgi:hypothetical protein
MKGSNTLLLNKATIIEAIQEYLDKRTLPTGRVRVTNATQPGNEAFTVIVEGVEPAESEKV